MPPSTLCASGTCAHTYIPGHTPHHLLSSLQATKETVIIISSKKDRHTNTTTAGEAGAASNATHAAPQAGARGSAPGTSGAGDKRGGEGDAASTAASTASKVELESHEADVDRIIDSKDNEYVLSKKGEESVMGIMLDPRLVKDLTVLIAASAVLGVAMEALGQPTINGYFLAGSAVGPGGLNWVSEPVQVQSLAQLGVQLLLFGLGLEFSLSKLRAVRGVALLGGALQVLLLAALCSGVAAAIGTDASLGAFVGALAGMSSTGIVVKCLADRRVQHSASGQIVIGTLVVQDCMVGLLFALMPLLGLARRAAAGEGGVGLAVLTGVLLRVATKLCATALLGVALSRFVLPRLVALLARSASAETQQMLAAGACCAAALVTTRLGISAELGAFVAGATLAAAGAGELLHARVTPLTQFFLALFISSTGMVLSPPFLLHHLPVLAAGALVLVAVKSVIVGGVVMAFGYSAEVATSVGLSLAQVGEFVFVLLSLAHAQELLATQVYLLLMGTTALSLLVTPFLLELSIRLGTGQSWLPVPTGGAGAHVELTALPVTLPPGVSGKRDV